MMDIYSKLEIWKEAYEYLLLQASTSWLSLRQVKNIVNNLGYSYRLESIVKDRLESEQLSENDRDTFLAIQDWLKNK